VTWAPVLISPGRGSWGACWADRPEIATAEALAELAFTPRPRQRRIPAKVSAPVWTAAGHQLAYRAGQGPVRQVVDGLRCRVVAAGRTGRRRIAHGVKIWISTLPVAVVKEAVLPRDRNRKRDKGDTVPHRTVPANSRCEDLDIDVAGRGCAGHRATPAQAAVGA
jgi:hypothetical protein